MISGVTGARVGDVVAAVKAGVSPLCDTAAPAPDEYGVLTLAAVTSRKIERHLAKRLDAAKVNPKWPTVRSGTILMTRASGSRDLVGACVLVEKDEPRLIPPDTAWILETANGHSARYLVEFLRSPRGRKAIHEITRGSSGIWKISQRSFLGLRLPAANERVECAVDRLAASFDAATATWTQLLDAKREFRRGLMQQLLTGRKRFPEFARSNESQFGQFGTVPKDWCVVHISEIAREIKIRGEIEGSVVYSCTKHEGLVPSLEYFGRQVFSRNLDGYKRLQEGDFAYATNHIEEGSLGLLRNGQPPGLVSPMYTVFRPTERVNPEFLFALLKTESYRRVFEIRMSASIDRRGSLRWKEFSRIKIGLPTMEEQKRIAETLRLLDVEIQQLEQLQELVELQKRALLSKLLSDEAVATS